MYLILSFFLVAFGQNAWVPLLAPIGASVGYALFWIFLQKLEQKRERFYLSLIWFAAVHMIQLSWLTDMSYMPIYVLGVYLALVLGVGLQFAFFCRLIKKELTQIELLKLAAIWTLLEWSRLFFLTGFTWNPAGLALTANPYTIQLASLVGVYGLSFWVMWTNLSFFRAYTQKKSIRSWALLTFIPFAYGMGQQFYFERQMDSTKKLHVALVDTNLDVEEKIRDKKDLSAFIPVLTQWERVWDVLEGASYDLIVLPEGAFPYSVDLPFCLFDSVRDRWEKYFSSKLFPTTTAGIMPLIDSEGYEHKIVNHTFLAQNLADSCNASLIAGFNKEENDKVYNAAFYFQPKGDLPSWYAKQILAPVGEYIPCAAIPGVMSFIEKEFGIHDSFEKGKEIKIFPGIVPIGISICLEETHGHFIRKFRKMGAELLVSLSNDAWFPKSKLARQHFDYGRLRAVENGVFVIRSSNKGMTGVIDCFGKTVAVTDSIGDKAKCLSIIIYPFSYPTLYTMTGDYLVVILCCLFLFIRKKLPLNSVVR